MPDYINFNGKITLAEEPVLTADNRSFSYGDGIFETMRISNGKILFLEDHMDRLLRGAAFMKLQLPDYFTTDFLQQQIFHTAESNQISSNARVKVIVFRGGKGKYEPEINLAQWIISISPLYRPDYIWNEKGLSLGIFLKAQKPCDASSNFKTTSSLIYVLASIYRKESGYDESLILNVMGNVADAIYSNVFIVHHKTIITPSLQQGCIDGVMRKQIIRLARKAGYRVVETVVSVSDVKDAEEIFLTNSVKGIMWIHFFEQKVFPNTISTRLLHLLNESIG